MCKLFSEVNALICRLSNIVAVNMKEHISSKNQLINVNEEKTDTRENQ